MRKLSIAWVVALICLSASARHAGAAPDPKILIAGSEYSQGVYGPTFSFEANATGGGMVDFFNASGFDWTELDIITGIPYGWVNDQWVALDSAEYYDISSPLFVNNSLLFGPGILTMRFWGVDDGHGGIPSTVFIPGDKVLPGDPINSHFFVNLDNVGTPDVGGWLDANGQPLGFNGTASAVPEPGTLALLGGGLLALGLGFRRRTR